MHAFVAAKDGVGRADLDAQGAADTPGLVNHRHVARALVAVPRVERQHRLAGQLGQALNALGAARRALVDAGLAGGHGLRIGGAVGVAATGALGLRQQGQNGGSRSHHQAWCMGLARAGLVGVSRVATAEPVLVRLGSVGCLASAFFRMNAFTSG